VWPAVSGFPDLEEAYSGEKGWEAKAGSKASITVPSKWMGRICKFRSQCTLSAIWGT